MSLIRSNKPIRSPEEFFSVFGGNSLPNRDRMRMDTLRKQIYLIKAERNVPKKPLTEEAKKERKKQLEKINMGMVEDFLLFADDLKKIRDYHNNK